MEENEPPEVEGKRRVAKAASIILVSEIFSRYSTAGVSSIVLLFLNLKLGYDRDVSTAIYHAYELFIAVFAVLGATLADSWLGIYKTIVLASTIFAGSCFLLAVSVVDSLHLPLNIISICCLVLLSVSEGCFAPLCSTFGALQYKPFEKKSIALFFSLFYFMLNCGSITSRFVSPILRQDVRCFGNDDCFALAFGIPGIFMALVGVTITIANIFSTATQRKGNTLLNVFACIWNAINLKIKSRKLPHSQKKEHWLDYSEEKYGTKLIYETRIILNVVVLYLPMPVFWALFFQQGSRWVFQAVRMNGDLGFYTIKPDQLNVVNPLIVLILIPLFEYVIYPQLSKIGLTTDLRKVTLGGIFAGLAFLSSAAVESQIADRYIHMGWLLPQYILMAIGETMHKVPLMNFSYAEAPSEMKTVLQAIRIISSGAGNLIVIIVAGSRMIDSQMYEFILFSGLMFIDIAIFAFLAKRYKTLNQTYEKVENILLSSEPTSQVKQ